MDRNIRYQVLQEERDDDVTEAISSTATNCSRNGADVTRPLSSLQTYEAPPSPELGISNPALSDDSLLPPAYEEISGEGQPQGESLQQEPPSFKTSQMCSGEPCPAGLPPSYAVATDLPSYEEAERLKREEEVEEEEGDHDGMRRGGGCRIHRPLRQHVHHHLTSSDGEHIHIEEVTERIPASAVPTDRLNGSGMTVGTDWIFFCTFIMSFLFNWLGFLMSLCITNTIAGRCGALAGLGLSMVKWVAIVKHSGFAGDLAAGESWFWWILMLCGFLLFIRGCMQYVNVKYEWKRITGRLHHFYLF